MKHYNTNIIKGIIDAFKLKGDYSDSQVTENITLTYEVKEPINISAYGQVQGANTTVIYTTPLDRDFYLTDFFHQFVTADGNDESYITLYTNGKYLVISTITARQANDLIQNRTVNHSFIRKLKIDRGTNITLSHSSAGTLQTSNCSILGVLID